MDDITITPSEYNQLAEKKPELAGALIQELLRLRAAGGSGVGGEGQDGWIDPWRPYRGLSDAYQERPPTPYLVERLLPLPGLAKIYGPPGTLKSMLLMDLAVCVAIDRPWLQGGDLAPFRVKKAPVLWLDLDQGESIMFQRLGAIGRGLGARIEECPFHFKSLPSGGFDLTNPGQVAEMGLRLNDLGAGMLCIDNLGVAKGAADENTDRMIPVMYNLRSLAEQTNSCVVILHHSRKENGYKARFGESSRGHTSITAAVDISLGIDRNVQDPDITITVGKVRRRPVGPFGALFHVEHAVDSDDMQRAWFSGLKETEAKLNQAMALQGQREAIEEAILEAVRAERLNQGSLIDSLKRTFPTIGRNACRQQLERMAAAGKLRIEKGDKNVHFYVEG